MSDKNNRFDNERMACESCDCPDFVEQKSTGGTHADPNYNPEVPCMCGHYQEEHAYEMTYSDQAELAESTALTTGR